MKKSILSALLACLALAPAARANTVYFPGLWQSQFAYPSDYGFKTQTNVAAPLSSNLVAVTAAAYLDRTPGVFMDTSAGNGPTPKQNPISGREWGWHNYDVYAYEGEMFVEAGRTYQFWGRFDDGEALVIDGKLVVYQGDSSGYGANPVVAASYTATKTGWVPFNAWIWDWTGGKNVMNCRFALQYNPTGTASTSYDDANVWQEIVDPGDMSLLRVAGTNAYTTVTAVTAAENGTDLKAAISFAGLPSAATVYACYGALDGGNAATSVWDNVAAVGTVAAGTSAHTFTIPGAAGNKALRLYVEGAAGIATFFTEWTDVTTLTVDPLVSLVSLAPGSAGVTATADLRALGVGASEADLALEVATAADGFDAPAFTFAYANNPATAIGTVALVATGLSSNTPYWFRVRATNELDGAAVSEVLPLTLSPTAPAGTYAFVGASGAKLVGRGTVSSPGDSSAWAKVRLEAAKDAAFASVAGVSPEVLAEPGAPVALEIAGLDFETEYFVRLRIVNDWGLEAFVVDPALRATGEAPFSPLKVYASGLIQAQLSGAMDRTTDILSHSTATNAPGAIMASTSGSATNPYNGKSYAWGGNTTFGYVGQMYMTGGTTYWFGKYVDDSGDVTVDGTQIMKDDTWNGFITASFTPAVSGWHDVEFRFGNGGGGAGANDGTIGFGYNTAGISSFTADTFKNGGPWSKAIDPGDLSLLRCVYSETPFLTIDSVAASGADLVVTASFAGVPEGTAELKAFFGAGNGGYDADEWSSSALVTNPPAGDTASAQYVVPGAADAAFVTFRLAGTAGVAIPYLQWSQTYNLAQESPVFGIAVLDVAYTNATFMASCTGMGAGADSVTAELQFSATRDFASVLRSVPLTLSGIGSQTLSVNGFTTNTTYYARVVGENGAHESGASSVASFTMLAPQPPEGRAMFGSRGFSSLSFVGVVSDWGAGSSSARLTLDVSTDPAFPAETTLSFPGAEALAGAVPASQTLTATGLAGATAYWARLRILNEWGFETSVPLSVSYDTLSTPFEMSAPGAAPGGEGVQTLSISCLSVEEGTTYDVTLSVDGKRVKTWSGLSEPGDFTADWTGKPGSSHSAVFAVSSSSGGAGFSAEYPFSFSVGGTILAVSSLDELATTILRVGDRLVLPALATGESLVYDTNAVVSLEGTTFTALEPGASRIRRYAADPVTGEAVLAEDGVLIVAPRDEDLHGAGLFVNRTATLGTVGWCNAASWQKISGDHDWPNGPGDVALVYLPLTEYTVTFDLGGNAVTVGHLGLGSTHSGNQIYLSNGTLTFRTADGSESRLRMAGRNEGAGNLTIGASIVLANDLVVDGMGAKDMGLVFNGVLDVGPHVFTTDRVPFRSSGDRNTDGQIQFKGDVTGTGEIRLRADSTASLGGWPSRKSFQGTWNPASCNHNGNYGGSGLFLGNAYLGHAAQELKVSGAWFADKDNHKGASVRTGWSNRYQYKASTNHWRGGVMPPKVTLDGGELNLITQGAIEDKPLEAYNATGVREDWFEIGEFRLSTGPMGALWSGISTWHDGCYPNSHTVVTNLVAEPGATAALGLDTSSDRGSGIISNDFHVVNAPAAAWDSGKGYEILPFFFPNAENQNRYVTVRDTATGRVRNVEPDGGVSATGIRQLGNNGRNDPMEDGAAWEAVAVYPWANCYFAQPNSTVRILSGYLNVVSTPFAPPDHANSASSTVDFGNRTAYVYVNRQNDTADIGCRVAGTAGFVKSAGGTLRLYRPMDALTGGVWVGAGRLSLLEDATLGDNDVFVAAGAKLRITGGNPFGARARLDLEDRDWISTASRIELENAEMARVRRLYVNGENLPRGYYGSSEAEASLAALASVGYPAFVDDRLFSGPGVLKVTGDDLLQPALMILR